MADIVNARWVIRNFVLRGAVLHMRLYDRRTGKLHAASTSERTAKKAKQFTLDYIRELEERERSPVRGLVTLFSVAAAEYLEQKSHTLRPTTLRVQRSLFESTLIPAFGSRALTDITAGDIEGHLARRKAARPPGAEDQEPRKPSARTVNGDLMALRALSKWCLRRKYTAEDFCDGVRRVRGPARQGRALSEEEARALIRAASVSTKVTVAEPKDGRKPWTQEVPAPDRLRLALLVALLTGIRLRSMTLLKWTDINFRRGTLRRSAEEQKDNRELVVPLHASLLRELTAARGAARSEFVFPGGSFTRAFRTAVDRAELGDLRWHDLRHSFATFLARKSPAHVVSALLGHSTGNMTARYLHATDDDMRRALTTLPDLTTVPATASVRRKRSGSA